MVQDEFGKVFLIKTSDRDFGVQSLLSQFDLSDYSGKDVALKANFNSSDPFPASTHLDTLSSLVTRLKEANIGDLVLAERSGMGDTRRVLEQMGVLTLSEKLGFKIVILNEETKEQWAKIDDGELHWLRGFYI
ncbi:MAG: DUF362 domain-containing protein [Candidatus Bathyarchaeota archaeon]